MMKYNSVKMLEQCVIVLNEIKISHNKNKNIANYTWLCDPFYFDIIPNIYCFILYINFYN